MNFWKDYINLKNGTVDFSELEHCSFEFIEELYEQIKQPLRERRERQTPKDPVG